MTDSPVLASDAEEEVTEVRAHSWYVPKMLEFCKFFRGVQSKNNASVQTALSWASQPLNQQQFPHNVLRGQGMEWHSKPH